MKKNNTAEAAVPFTRPCPEKIETPHDHLHAANCGHKSYVHNGHICYEHEGHYHYWHKDHFHACSGPKEKYSSTVNTTSKLPANVQPLKAVAGGKNKKWKK